MQITVAGVTDPGRIRFRNEDRYLLHPPILAVADGMGGHLVGDKAAQTVIDSLAAVPWDGVDGADAAVRLQRCVDESRAKIVTVIKEGKIEETATRVGAQPGAGTTVAGAVYIEAEAKWLVFHIGDSRVYMWREGRLRRLTRDHSLVQELIDEGELTEEEARVHPRKAVITRAVGSYGESTIDTSYVDAREGDTIIVCSDGLSDELDDSDVSSVIVDVEDGEDEVSLDAVAFALRDVALTRGGRDNVTVALMKIGVSE